MAFFFQGFDCQYKKHFQSVLYQHLKLERKWANIYPSGHCALFSFCRVDFKFGILLGDERVENIFVYKHLRDLKTSYMLPKLFSFLQRSD